MRKIEFKPANVNDIEYTMLITMPLKDWVRLRWKLKEGEAFDAYDQFAVDANLVRKIEEMVDMAEHYWCEVVE